MDAKSKQKTGIFLVGFMGSGKSTVGQLLAERLGWEFVDLDDEIARRQGVTISEIFEQSGEPFFRDLEHRALVEQAELVAAGRPRVVALGGGTFAVARNREQVESAGVSVWLDCPVTELWARVSGHDHRPLAQDRARFEALYEERRPAYGRADFRMDGTRSAQQIVDTILSLEEKGSSLAP